MTQEEENSRVIITKGALVSFLTEDYNNTIKDKVVHLDLINNINLLIDKDPGFFMFSDISDYNFNSIILDIIHMYRSKYNDNVNLCNNVIKNLNGLNVYNSKDRSNMRLCYLTEQEIDRDRKIENLDDMFYSILHDSALYSSLLTGDLSDLDNYDSIIDSTIYLYNNYNELYENSNICKNNLTIIEGIINNSRKLSNNKKNAKQIKKVLLSNL
ncbi:MAG: hypothetical protein IJF92_04140 [Bacilli bacterium]|nr:hypothetical protein [Bacilli bacterium]